MVGTSSFPTYLFRVQSIVETQTSNRLDVLERERRQQQAHVGYLVCHLMLPKDVAGDDPSPLRLGNIRHAPRQDGISVVYLAISGEETDESLWVGVCVS